MTTSIDIVCVWFIAELLPIDTETSTVNSTASVTVAARSASMELTIEEERLLSETGVSSVIL